MHWIGWEKMKLPKSEGGLGFRDLFSFNMAMRYAFRVLSAKYFPDGDVLKARPLTGMSYVWRSILKGIQLLKAGLIWLVGDGKSIDVWRDP
jgi:hypothetical protein